MVEYRENPIRDAYSKFDEYIEHCYHARCPVFVWGPPGIGKSDGIKRVARKLGIKCIDMRLTQMDAVDLRGLPVIEKTGTPDCVRKERNSNDTGSTHPIETVFAGFPSAKIKALKEAGFTIEDIAKSTQYKLGKIPGINRKDALKMIKTAKNVLSGEKATKEAGNSELTQQANNFRKAITEWVPPSDLPRNGKGILFLDELNLAPPSVQHAAYQLILNRKLGDYHLPQGWFCVAAGNRVEDRAHVSDLPSPLANRFVHFDLDVPPLKLWNEWAWNKGIDERIIAFLQWKSEWLFHFEPDKNQRSFPTPRTWERCSDLIKSINHNTEKDLAKIRDLATMAVGLNASGEFIAFISYFSKIDPVKLLNKKNYVFPRNNIQKAMSELLVMAYHVKNNKQYGDKFLNHLLNEDVPAEYSVLGIQLAFTVNELHGFFKQHRMNARMMEKLKDYLLFDNK
ncbi:MAG: hypothetical protein ACTSRU_05795 [Candidatus Hodarchaeales archaeon]